MQEECSSPSEQLKGDALANPQPLGDAACPTASTVQMLLLDSPALHHCSVEPKPGVWVIGIFLLCFVFVGADAVQRAAVRTGMTAHVP